MKNAKPVIVRGRTCFSRLANQSFAEMIRLDQPGAAAKARDILSRSVDIPVDL